jgi:hypothetical protein
MLRLHTDERPTSALTELRRRVRARRVRFEGELERSPAHGSGEVLDVFVWGTLRRVRGPIELEVREAARDLAAIARDALPRATAEIHLDALPLEPAVFEPTPGGPDHIRLAFRVVASTPGQLKTWRGRLHENLKTLGVGNGDGAGPVRPR